MACSALNANHSEPNPASAAAGRVLTGKGAGGEGGAGVFGEAKQLAADGPPLRASVATPDQRLANA